jgi:hypothetical protein
MCENIVKIAFLDLKSLDHHTLQNKSQSRVLSVINIYLCWRKASQNCRKMSELALIFLDMLWLYIF